MNHLKTGILLSAVALSLGACSDENPWQGDAGQGGISLRLTPSGQIRDARSTRAGDDLRVPEAGEFSVSLTKLDNSYHRTWETLDDFDAESGFPAGAYTLRAFYGDIETEGFDCPAFEGKTEISVLEGRETPVSLTATLANSMVSVEYTDEFRGYFTSWSATLHSEGHGYVEVPQTETRPAFIAPGDVTLTVEFTDQKGHTARLEAASFAAAPATHYHVTLNVNGGNVGDATLEITFDETVTTEDVVIDLTDELFATPAPTLSPVGFESGAYFDEGAYSELSSPAKIDILAKGGLKSARLSVQSATWEPPFGTEIDLCAATPAQQAQLTACGISAMGLYRNPDRMAVIDLTGVGRVLPEGVHTFSLVATDLFGRTSEPVTLTVDSSPITVSATALGSVFGSGEAMIEVAYNGKNPDSDISFEVMNDYGIAEPVRIISWSENTGTRALATRSYTFVIEMPASSRVEVPVRVLLRGEQAQMISVAQSFPQYEVEADALATSVRLRVKTDDDSMLGAVTRGLRFFVAGGSDATVSRDDSKGLVTIAGLHPATDYSAGITLLPGSDPEIQQHVAFRTEAATALANGSFTDLAMTINTQMNAGGQYKYGMTTMQNKTTVQASEPTGWASVNALTCWLGSTPLNTWFAVPSTMASTGSVTLRSVAYDHQGTLPALDNHGLSVRAKYSRNKPSSWSGYAAGELFLGSYTYDGTEHRTDGISFASRPASVSYTYSYAPVSGEKGLVYVAVLDASGSVIAERSEQISAGSGTRTLALPQYPFGVKGATLRLGFKSSDAAVPTAPVPSDIADVTNTTSLSGQTLGVNAYKSLCTGSALTLTNVTLNY